MEYINSIFNLFYTPKKIKSIHNSNEILKVKKSLKHPNKYKLKPVDLLNEIRSRKYTLKPVSNLNVRYKTELELMLEKIRKNVVMEK